MKPPRNAGVSELLRYVRELERKILELEAELRKLC